jgi:branched-subunit amino acid aminotransferase/4-amino-4-deoxychorismate lyase
VRWVEERKCFVDPALEETLLLDPAGQVLEGSQTNFFAVERGPVLVTAKDGVLLGTVRASVLEACAALGIAVRLQAPGVGDVHEWQECFISSTSRLVMGVDEIRPCPEWGSAQTHVLPAERPVTSRIQQWVQAHLWEMSAEHLVTDKYKCTYVPIGPRSKKKGEEGFEPSRRNTN